ncbi:hypothetical protein VIOR103205_01070 [Vibrio ordalii]|nr:hypothetical protein [Vibrio ordalii]
MLLTRKTSLAIAIAIASLSHLPFIAHAQNQSDDVMVVLRLVLSRN